MSMHTPSRSTGRLLHVTIANRASPPPQAPTRPAARTVARSLAVAVAGLAAACATSPNKATASLAQPQKTPGDAAQASAKAGAGAASEPKPAQPASVLPPGTREEARFAIEHGLFGEVGHLNITLTHPRADPAKASKGDGQPLVMAEASGRGGVWGLGKESRQLAAQFKSDTPHPHAWHVSRRYKGKNSRVEASQSREGRVELFKQADGKSDSRQTFTGQGPVFDPLGVLMLVRSGAVKTPTTVDVLDRRNLWQITIKPVGLQRAFGKGPQALAYSLKAKPLTWSRKPSKKRKTKRLTLWIANDEAHTPLGLKADTSMGEIRIPLTGFERRSLKSPPETPTDSLNDSPVQLQTRSLLTKAATAQSI